MGERKIIFFGGFGNRAPRAVALGLRKARTFQISFFGLQAEDADLIGLRGANLADPDDAEAGFSPEAADPRWFGQGS